MSRIGKLPISIPAGVKITVKDGVATVKGPKGELFERIPGLVNTKEEGGTLVVSRDNDSRGARANQGLVRSLIANMVTGVSSGFEKTLVINGIGYRAELKGGYIYFLLGYSHPILYELPQGVSAELDRKANTIKLTGASKQVVGATAAEIRAMRPPEPYKGKGVRYIDEVIRRKEGKSA